MVVSPRTIVGIAGTLGGSCAVGVPLGLWAQSSREVANSGMQVSAESSQLAGGDVTSSSTSNLNLQKCSGSVNNVSTLPFGNSTEDELCWNWKSDESPQSLDATVESSLTQLFKDMWTRGVTNWHSISTGGVWKAFCRGSNWPQWVLQVDSSAAGNEYLGYCGGNFTSFLDIEKSTGSEPNGVKSLKLCLSDCWSDSSNQASTTPPIFSTKNEDSWKELIFLKNIK